MSIDQVDGHEALDGVRFYSAMASTRSPKLVIFLVDESNSMNGPCGQLTKSRVLDTHVNKALRAVINLNNSNTGVKDRMWVAVLGYTTDDSTNHEQPQITSLFEDQAEEFEQVKVCRPLSDIQALEVDVVDDTKQFVRSNPRGWTPMAYALKRAGTVIRDWVSERLAEEAERSGDSGENQRFPLPAPVIINVSDGIPTDDDQDPGPVERWSSQLAAGGCYPTQDGKPLMLRDGPPLLINVGTPGTTDSAGPTRLVFPLESELPVDGSDASRGIRRLWNLSSELHPNLLRVAIAKGLVPKGASHVGRRVYVNAHNDATLLDQVFEFGSELGPH